MGEAKGARRSDFPAESPIVQVYRKLLHANHWVREVNQAVDLILIAWLNANAPVSLLEGDSLANQQRPPGQWLTNNTGLLNHLRKHFRRAVQNRNLEVINVNITLSTPSPRNADKR